MKRPSLVAAMAVLLLLCCCMPVSAVLLEVTYKGQVATANPVKNTLTIKTPEQYGCDYPPTGDPVCGWTPLDPSSITGTVPDPAAYSVFSGSELVVATSLGGEGGEWTTLAKLYGSKDTQQLITDIVGDPKTVPYPLLGNYSVDTEMIPDCSACNGTICAVKQAKVTIKSSDRTVEEKTLTHGESFTYNGRNDGSAVTVQFISGSAASQSCPGMSGMTGPQARSVFLITVTPPVGYEQVNIRTATTTRLSEALTKSPVTVTMSNTATQTTSQTPSVDLCPSAALVAVFCAAVVCTRWM